MSQQSPSLSLPLMQPAQAQKHVTHNEALMALDVLVQLVVEDIDRTAPPAAPSVGQCHVVGAGAGGDWDGRDGQIACYTGAFWSFTPPRAGWRAWVGPEARPVIFDGTAWGPEPLDSQNLAGVGINTTSDGVNRLAVSAEATLLSHDGAGHQLKINKAASGDTASLLFQTGWGGRAEMGTAGTDAFAVKVSADGATWTTALSLDPVTGLATGAAVQGAATDTTPGRLMRTDWGYGRGTLLGTVGQSGGTPTGAAIERGANANGDYVRFADGTQICQAEVTLAYINGSICSATWTFPAAFAGGSQPQATANISANELLSSAPGISPNQLTPLVLGAFSTVSAALQIRTLPGYAFSPGNSVVLRTVAVGRWF